MSLFGSMWGVCSGLRLRKPLAAVGGMTRDSAFSLTCFSSLPVKWSERKRQFACFSNRYSLFLWRQQRDRVEQFVPALRVSTICSATQQQSVQLWDRRSTSLPFLTIVTRLPNRLLFVGSLPSHENLWQFCLQALELEFPFTGTVLDLLRSSMEKRWPVTWMFDSSDSPQLVFSMAEGSSSVHTALVLLPTWAGASFWQEPHHPVLGHRGLPQPARGWGSSGVYP